MTSRDFCYWLQGHFEISKGVALNEEQVIVVQNHLSMVFAHEIDPSMPDPLGKLGAFHAGSASVALGSPNQQLRC